MKNAIQKSLTGVVQPTDVYEVDSTSDNHPGFVDVDILTSRLDAALETLQKDGLTPDHMEADITPTHSRLHYINEVREQGW